MLKARTRLEGGVVLKTKTKILLKSFWLLVTLA